MNRPNFPATKPIPSEKEIARIAKDKESLEKSLRKVADPNWIKQKIVDICEAAANNGEPNWPARVKGVELVMQILMHTDRDPQLRNLQPAKIIINVVDGKTEIPKPKPVIETHEIKTEAPQ